MNYLNFRVTNAAAGAVIVVTIDHSANVLLMDTPNFHQFTRSAAHRYYGGWYTTSPVRLVIPSTGDWHVVVHLGGRVGQVKAAVTVAA